MKTITQLALSIGLVLAGMSAANAFPAQVEVQWQDTDEYTDFESANQPKEPFATRTKGELTEYLQELAATLPKEHKLIVTFEDVDLAGRIEPTYGAANVDYYRVLDDISSPKLVISYQYLTATDEVIKAEENLVLRKVSPIRNTRSLLATGRDSLYLEKELLKDWFNSSFTNSRN